MDGRHKGKANNCQNRKMDQDTESDNEQGEFGGMPDSDGENNNDMEFNNDGAASDVDFYGTSGAFP